MSINLLFNPDVVFTILHDTKTGQTKISTRNGQQLSAMAIAQLCNGVVQAQLVQMVKDSNMLINPNRTPVTHEPERCQFTTATNARCALVNGHEGEHRYNINS